MGEHLQRAASVADKIISLVDDGLRGIDRTIATWPAEFRAIVWEAVADTASRRAKMARADHVGQPVTRGEGK